MMDTVTASAETTITVETPFQRFARNFFSSKIATAGFIALCFIVLAAIFAPVIAPQNPYDLTQIDIMDSAVR